VLTVLLGGARSGKSSLAERLAADGGGSVTYLATCPRIDGDDELADRIARHRSDRPTTWTTVEEERDIAGAIDRTRDATLIVDCLTTWVSNLQFGGCSEHEILRRSEAAVDAVHRRRGRTIVISNEVGLGIVPAEASVRHYRDLLGRVNQQWVSAADRALLLVAGRALPLHDVDDIVREPT
jgi:adenosyl cobinamide kinase/adenosyl cobinamide phosphate guanylyltransferase